LPQKVQRFAGVLVSGGCENADRQPELLGDFAEGAATQVEPASGPVELGPRRLPTLAIRRDGAPLDCRRLLEADSVSDISVLLCELRTGCDDTWSSPAPKEARPVRRSAVWTVGRPKLRPLFSRYRGRELVSRCEPQNPRKTPSGVLLECTPRLRSGFLDRSLLAWLALRAPSRRRRERRRASGTHHRTQVSARRFRTRR
jgi:hypothetical protein